MDYFFIASQDEPSKVLEIAGSKHGGDLCIWQARETTNNNQLWTLNEKGQLVSKISLVADIANGDTIDMSSEGAKVIAWSPHDGLNQRWMFEDGKLMSGLSNLYMEADRNGDIKMKSSSNSKRQLWTLVPVEMLAHYKLMTEAAPPQCSSF